MVDEKCLAVDHVNLELAPGDKCLFQDDCYGKMTCGLNFQCVWPDVNGKPIALQGYDCKADTEFESNMNCNAGLFCHKKGDDYTCQPTATKKAACNIDQTSSDY